MPIIKNELPILEYDTQKEGVIKPDRAGKDMLPSICVMTFFKETLDKFVAEQSAQKIGSYNSEMGIFPVYHTTYNGVEICLIQAVVGAPSVAMMTEYLVGYGVKVIIACGGCGVLDNIPAGDIIIPTSALRDEGTSYHYLPPSREIKIDADMVNLIESVLKKQKMPFIKCKTWTTDAFYRETPDMITYRKQEGCVVVEMECAAIAAVTQYRGIKFGQLLYSGDNLSDYESYDEREWWTKVDARGRLFLLSLQIATEM